MKRFHPRTLLIVLAACSASCGDDTYSADDYDDQNENVNTSDGGVQGAGGDGSVAADAGNDAAPWGSGSNDASAPDGGSWDASQASDSGPGGYGDAGGYDAGRTDAGGNDAGGGGTDAGPSCDSLTYETFGRQFMTDYCVGCHGASNPRANLSLTSLSAIVTAKARVKSAVTGGAMPQGTKKPSTAERERLGQWIDCGPR